MTYTYLDHAADIGIRATGADIREAFAEGARALLALTADLDRVRPTRTWRVRCRAPARDTLFVAWLNEILGLAGVEGALFRDATVDTIGVEGEEHVLSGTLRGEPFDPARHRPGTEVKAATYAGLRLTEAPGRVTVQCVLDL